jgi:hypothetical protein
MSCSGSERSDKMEASEATKTTEASTKAGLRKEFVENSYFLGAIESLAALATRNFTTVLAAILIGSPV